MIYFTKPILSKFVALRYIFSFNWSSIIKKISIGDNTCIKHVYQFHLIRNFVAYYLETDVPSCSKKSKKWYIFWR